ncbi:MAG: diiron oxygenase [Acidimicrobiia bacterium]|nr:diiron oxygenase [Acidimicrobiia bacterium]
MDASPPTTIDLDRLGVDRGGHLLVDRALRDRQPGDRIRVVGRDPNLGLHLRAWAREHGHTVNGDVLTKGTATTQRWRAAVRAGTAAEPASRADPTWGLAARGALVEGGGPALAIADLLDRDVVWTDLAPKLYAQAAANQWDPATAIDWTHEDDLPWEVEDAVVQVMTYLVENEQAALAVPARHLARIHPQFREVAAFLATQVADEARHVEVFTRRAQLHRDAMGSSTVGGRASLQTLVDEPDFSLASFLLTVLGEGTFLDLLSFLERYAPDPVTRRVAHLARQDEARHVAFGQGHLEHRVAMEPALRVRLREAIERRHESLRRTAGLNTEVHDALVLLAAGSFTADAIATGWERVQALTRAMQEGRTQRLVRLGFPPSEADELAALHTRNFM